MTEPTGQVAIGNCPTGETIGHIALWVVQSALSQATRMLPLELGATGISVKAIAPAAFETKTTKVVQEDRKRYERELGVIPLGRWGGDLTSAASPC